MSADTAARLDAARAPWLVDPAVRRVLSAFAPADQPRFVGGCVRNALIEGGPTDLDIAVVCPPETTLARLAAAGVKSAPTGIEHGTVLAIAERETGHGEPIEITTLREDVETDGRRAVVSFTDDWRIDAERRDFTMNALYADPDGTVVDPLGQGLADLAARRVRFIGQAEERIREDYLRILRFFRFTAWYGRAAPEPADVAAVTELKSGVAGLARERIGHETRKLFAAPDPAAALGLMAETGADDALYGAPLGRDAADWRRLHAVEAALGLAPAWTRRLLFAYAALGEALVDLLRLSRAEASAIRARLSDDAPEAIAYAHGAEAALDVAALGAAEHGAPPDPDAPARLAAAAERRFPLTAKDLIAAGVAPGPALGAALKSAERRWIDSGFALERDELLAKPPASGK